MGLFIQISQFFIALTILVFIHELGHFFFARLFKTRVDKFYLFFNPYFSLYKFQKGETEWGIGWLPLGGYCKIAGMIDESFDKAQMATPPQPWEYRSKKAWQRLLIITGGVLFNFLLALILFIGIKYTWGDHRYPISKMTHGIAVDPLLEDIGLKNGDKIVSIGSKEINYFDELNVEVLLGMAQTINIERAHEIIELNIPNEFYAKAISSNRALINFRHPLSGVIDSAIAGQAASLGGLESKDSLMTINGKYFMFFDELKNFLNEHIGQNVVVTYSRGEIIDSTTVLIPKSARLGVSFRPASHDTFYPRETHYYSLIGAIPAGIHAFFRATKEYVRQFKLFLKPETKAYNSVGSFVSITNLFPSSWNWYAFWSLTAMLSIMLGVVNILPIPALDGGHFVFIIYEMITGRKPSENFLQKAQYIGFVLLLSLLGLALYNDINKFLFK